jgi:preprotein translocase subunit Sss1
LSKANAAQNKARAATTKVRQAKKDLEDIAAILSTVEEPGEKEYTSSPASNSL